MPSWSRKSSLLSKFLTSIAKVEIVVRLHDLLCSLRFRVFEDLPDLALSGLEEGLVASILLVQEMELIIVYKYNSY